MTAVPHTIALVMQDQPGVLHRTVSLLRRRGYNIESLAVGPSEAAGVSRMTLVVEAGDVEQVTRQLDRLVEVLAVCDLTHEVTVERETALLKIDATPAERATVLAAASGHQVRVADTGPATLVLEVTDAPARVDDLIVRMRGFGIRELVRTGRVVLARGPTAPTAGSAPGGGPDPDHPAPAGSIRAAGLP